MSRKLKNLSAGEKMQYLMKCDDTSMCIIFERSIIEDPNIISLGIGDRVKFLWPEDSSKPRTYSGEILMKSPNEDILHDKMDALEKADRSKTQAAKSEANGRAKKKSCKSRADKGESILKNKITSLMRDVLCSEMKSQMSPVAAAEGKEAPDEASDLLKPAEAMNIDQNNIQCILDEMKLLVTDTDSVTAEIISLSQKQGALSEKLQQLANTISSLIVAQKLSHEPSTSTQNGSQGKKRHSSEFLANLNDTPQREKGPSSNFRNDLDDDCSQRKKRCSSNFTSDVEDVSDDDESINLAASKSLDVNEPELFSWTSLSSPEPSFKTYSRKRKIIYSDEDSNNEDLPDAENKKKKTNDVRDRHFGDEVKLSIPITIPPMKSQIPESKVTINLGNDNDNDNMEDGSWTLKCKNDDKNVTELGHGSGIYVDVAELRAAKDTTGNQTQFARALLECVFHMAALKQCSIRGRQANGRGSKDKENKTVARRPPLHQKGLQAIISYAKAYAKRRQWVVRELQPVQESLRQRIQELKPKSSL